MNHQNDDFPFVSTIILNYNAGELLLECVKSVLKTNYPNFEIIIVDNASKDESHIKCKKQFPEIHLIENEQNLGYCEGNNVGIEHARGMFVAILNPDTIVDSDWLLELVLAYKQFGDALYQPKFLTTTDHKVLMSAGNMIQLFGFGYCRGKGQIDHHLFEKIEQIGYASGTCLFASTHLMKELGMFDSFLFAYHDDLDLGWRASLQGVKSYYVPKSVVFHPPEGFSFKWSPLKFYLLERNRQYCILTHFSYSTIFKMLPALVVVDLVVFIFYLKKGLLKQKIKASLNIIQNYKIIKKRHKEIQNRRTIPDKDMIKNFSDYIAVPNEISDKKINKIFNSFISNISKFTRKII